MPGVPPIDVDRYLEDHAGELARARGEHWWAQGLDWSGAAMPWVLRMERVRELLRDRRLSPRSFVDDMRAAGLSQETTEQLTPLFRRDGDEHRRHRSLLSAAFTPRRVERLRPVAADVAHRLASELATLPPPAPFVATFASALPPEVFAVLFGLPADDRDRLATWSGSVGLAFMPGLAARQVDEVERAAAELREYCRDLIARRRAEPADDLITHLLEVEVDGERLDEREVVATMSGFIFAGSETTRRQLTALVLAFAQHPDAWSRVAADPDLVPTAIEEVLRRHGIVPGLSRLAVERFEHEGLVREPGTRLLLSFDAANRDPEAFPDPDVFDVGRADAGEHVTFGWGPHFCLGAGLARVELQEALRALVSRFGPPEVADAAVGSAGSFGTPDELLVTFPPAPAGTEPTAPDVDA